MTPAGHDLSAEPLPAERGPLRAGSALAPFRYPPFRAIWTANLISSVGSVMQAVAAAWLMTELTSRHLLVALVQASSTIPILLLGVIAGAIADNHDRRLVMLWAQVFMLFVSAVLSVMGYAGVITPWSLLLLTLMVGMGTALNGPAWQASVRMQVDRADLPQAISINAIAFNLARSLGPALGGLVISLWSVNLAFAINAVSYLAMIVVLARWHPAVTPPLRLPIGPAIMTGLRFCLTSGPIARVLLRGAVFGFGAAGFQALLPVVVRLQLHGHQVDYGLVVGAFGFGSVLAALFVAKVRRRIGSENVVGISTAVFVAAQVLLSSAHGVAPAMVAALIAGSGWVATMTSLNVAMQMRSPEAILARCMSIYQAVSFGGMALGAWVWGALADRAGLVFSLRAAALWLALTLVLRLIAPMPARAEGRIEEASNAPA
ncbi:MFS transporter [Novosphingobium sp.]|uniref:MFS transporter n=1 Tax=Novosphingobium sp. TaxID=1874826 RepID=UPI0033402345